MGQAEARDAAQRLEDRLAAAERKAAAALEEARSEQHAERGRLQAAVSAEQDRVRRLEEASNMDMWPATIFHGLKIA